LILTKRDLGFVFGRLVGEDWIASFADTNT